MAQVTGKKVATTPMPTPTGTSGAIIDSFNTQDDQTVNAPSIHIVKDALTTINGSLVKLSPTTQVTSTSIKNSDYTNVTISTAGLYSIKVKNNDGVTATLNVGIQDSNGNRIFELIRLNAGSYATLQTPFFYMEAGTYSIRASGGSLGELIKLS